MGYGRNTAQAIYWGKVQIVHSCLVNTCYIVIPMLFKTRRKIILLHAYNYDDNIENAGWRGLTTVEWEVCTRVRRCFSSSTTQCINHAQLHTEHTHPHLPRNCMSSLIGHRKSLPANSWTLPFLIASADSFFLTHLPVPQGSCYEPRMTTIHHHKYHHLHLPKKNKERKVETYLPMVVNPDRVHGAG